MEALEIEIEDIRKQKIEEEAEKLREEALKAKMEAEQEKKKPAPEISGKRSRKFPAGLKGMKGKLEKLKRRSEIRLPPTG